MHVFCTFLHPYNTHYTLIISHKSYQSTQPSAATIDEQRGVYNVEEQGECPLLSHHILPHSSHTMSSSSRSTRLLSPRPPCMV